MLSPHSYSSSKMAYKSQKCLGDLVLMQDINEIRGDRKLGKITELEKSKNSYVRNCPVKYKLIMIFP